MGAARRLSGAVRAARPAFMPLGPVMRPMTLLAAALLILEIIIPSG
jgi:hypothetical protein